MARAGLTQEFFGLVDLEWLTVLGTVEDENIRTALGQMGAVPMQPAGG